MITIENISNPPTETGINTYQVAVKGNIMATFQHPREDGLVACLCRAAYACEDARNKANANAAGVMNLLSEHFGVEFIDVTPTE